MSSRQRGRWWRMVLIPCLALLVPTLAACSPAPESPALSPQPTSAPTATRASQDVDESAPSPSASPGQTATVAPTQTPGETAMEDLAPTPTLRVGLQATDPSTVDLASGGPTLVEFFAFW